MNESRFRWVGRPSEEELLGLPPNGTRRASGFRPVPPAPRLHDAPAIVADAPGRPVRAWHLVALGAVGAAVGLAFGIAERGLPGEPPGPVVPTVAESSIVRTIAPDRELHSVPERRPRTGREGREQPSTAPAGDKTQKPADDDGSSGSKGGDDPQPPPQPPTETSDPPLLEASVAGVGTVTVEDPGLPDAEQLLPETSTLPLP